jgi:hypothetical protein
VGTLEVLIAVGLLTVGVVQVAQVALRCSQLRRHTSAFVKAHDTARDILEQMHAGPLPAHLAHFAAQPAFEVDGQQVQVSFPAELLEPVFGGPAPLTQRYCDQDGDGQVEFHPESILGAGLLPVRVCVASGGLGVEVQSLIKDL